MRTTNLSLSVSAPSVSSTTQSSLSLAATRRPTSNAEAFPALPSAPKPLTTIFGVGGGGRAVRRDLGSNRETGFSWGGSNGVAAPDGAAPSGEDEAASGGGKGKKKKGKQVLVSWG